MKKNVTLKLDAEILHEVRVIAAREGTSVSALLSNHLKEIVIRSGDYDRARERAIKRMESGFDLGGTKPLSREEAHDR